MIWVIFCAESNIAFNSKIFSQFLLLSQCNIYSQEGLLNLICIVINILHHFIKSRHSAKCYTKPWFAAFAEFCSVNTPTMVPIWYQYDITERRVGKRFIVCCLFFNHSVLSDSATPWTVAHQASPSMELYRQEYWSGLLSPLVIFPTQGLKLPLLCLLHWQVNSLPLCHVRNPHRDITNVNNLWWWCPNCPFQSSKTEDQTLESSMHDHLRPPFRAASGKYASLSHVMPYSRHCALFSKSQHHFLTRALLAISLFCFKTIFNFIVYFLPIWQVPRIDAFELWCWRRLLRVPWTARRSNQSILKETSPGCSLEGLMLKLKLQYFGHLMWRVDSLEKTLMLGGVGGRRRRGRQRMRWMDGWHHWLNGRESEWAPGVGDGQEGLACCDSWGCKELDTTERLNWTELKVSRTRFGYTFAAHCL